MGNQGAANVDKIFRSKIIKAFQKNDCQNSFAKEVIKILWAENMIQYNEDGKVIANPYYWFGRRGY